MIKCSFCGKEVKPGTKFCTYCGRQVPAGEEISAPPAPQAPTVSPGAPAEGPSTTGPPPHPWEGAQAAGQAVSPAPPPTPGTLPTTAESRGKLKKVLLIGIPSLVVIAGIVVALLFLFVLGKGGMSAEEYREQVIPLHEEVQAVLGEMEPLWDMDETPDVMVIDYYTEWESINQDLKDAVAAAQLQPEEFEPPQNATSVNEELLAYYLDIQEFSDAFAGATAYMKEQIAIMDEWNQIPYAISDSSSATTVEELISLLQQDIDGFDAVIGRLRALEVPQEMQEVNQLCIQKLELQKQFFVEFQSAMVQGDQARMDEMANEEVSTIVEDASMLANLYDYFAGVSEKVDELIEKGKTLQQDIQAIP